MGSAAVGSRREIEIARVLRPLGTLALSREQADRAAQLLGVHWTTVYRLRARFLRDPVASALVDGRTAVAERQLRLSPAVENIVEEVIVDWLPRQHDIAHPTLDVHTEVRRRCGREGLKAPSRNTIARRMMRQRDEELRRLAREPGAVIPPGSLPAASPLEIVQIDHTQADLFVVDRSTRRVMGRPWVSVAIDVATRCVVGFYVAMERPNAATVALLISRVVLPKEDWLVHLGLEIDWPMRGVPKLLHLDNAAEFHSRALRTGSAEYGIDLDYRPVGRPHYGGHIERFNRTLMQRLKGLPGATGSSTKNRKRDKPEERACLTLMEFERWLALEIGERYHHSEHRGLYGATPHAAWTSMIQSVPARQLRPGPEEALRLLIHFMPLQRRTIQADGLTLFYIRYWHPIFIVWREDRRGVWVRYHPEDLSRVYVSADGKNYLDARYADLRRPSISLWEQRFIVRTLRSQNHPRISEALLFKAIEQQRRIVDKAQKDTKQATRGAGRPVPRQAASAFSHPVLDETKGVEVDYTTSVDGFPVEIW